MQKMEICKKHRKWIIVFKLTMTHWCQTRAPNKGHFTEQAEILHEKRITTSFVSESCMLLGN